MTKAITLRNGAILFPVHLTRPGAKLDRSADNVIRLPVRKVAG